MIFVIANKIYDTEKMVKIADVRKWYRVESYLLRAIYGDNEVGKIYKCEMWRSNKENWLLTSERDYNRIIGEAITEEEAKELLLKFDFQKYKDFFGEIEEA